jgi:hypothetical protein
LRRSEDPATAKGKGKQSIEDVSSELSELDPEDAMTALPQIAIGPMAPLLPLPIAAGPSRAIADTLDEGDVPQMGYALDVMGLDDFVKDGL